MKVYEVVVGRWWPLGKRWGGVVIYPFIFYRDAGFEKNLRLRRHEWVHIEQVRRIGWLSFYLSWLRCVLRRIPYEYRWFEKEAIERADTDKNHPWLLNETD